MVTGLGGVGRNCLEFLVREPSVSSIAGVMYGGGDLCRVHKVDEFISIDELVEVTKVFAGLTIELCAY